MTILVVV